jgi:hypothetical protein
LEKITKKDCCEIIKIPKKKYVKKWLLYIIYFYMKCEIILYCILTSYPLYYGL